MNPKRKSIGPINIPTKTFLAECKKEGLTMVCIQVSHPMIPESVDFPFGPEGSVFGAGGKRDGRDEFGWPAIWEVVGKLKYAGGAGNSFQSQLNSIGQRDLCPGAYRLRAGFWYKNGKKVRCFKILGL